MEAVATLHNVPWVTIARDDAGKLESLGRGAPPVGLTAYLMRPWYRGLASRAA
jgi:hypothetical protein